MPKVRFSRGRGDGMLCSISPHAVPRYVTVQKPFNGATVCSLCTHRGLNAVQYDVLARRGLVALKHNRGVASALVHAPVRHVENARQKLARVRSGSPVLGRDGGARAAGTVHAVDELDVLVQHVRNEGVVVSPVLCLDLDASQRRVIERDITKRHVVLLLVHTTVDANSKSEKTSPQFLNQRVLEIKTEKRGGCRK